MTLTARGQCTRERIIADAAPLFNRKGYLGVTMEEILLATGLKKGGIYRHFASKEALALAAFDYSYGLFSRRIVGALETAHSSKDQLVAILGELRRMAAEPPIEGGCPVLNTAVESSEGVPSLMQKARQAMDKWRETLRGVVSKGILTGEIALETNSDDFATFFIATIEGAVFLAKLYGDIRFVHRASDMLEVYVRTRL